MINDGYTSPGGNMFDAVMFYRRAEAGTRKYKDFVWKVTAILMLIIFTLMSMFNS